MRPGSGFKIYKKRINKKKRPGSGNSSSSLLPQVLLLRALQGVREGLPQYSEPKSGHKVGTRISKLISPTSIFTRLFE